MKIYICKDPDNVDPDVVEILEDTLSIGDFLGLPWSASEELRRSYQSNIKRKEAYLDTYTHQHLCPSWKKISEVLKDCNLHEQAEEVENTYVQTVHSIERLNSVP